MVNGIYLYRALLLVRRSKVTVPFTHDTLKAAPLPNTDNLKPSGANGVQCLNSHFELNLSFSDQTLVVFTSLVHKPDPLQHLDVSINSIQEDYQQNQCRAKVQLALGTGSTYCHPSWPTICSSLTRTR